MKHPRKAGAILHDLEMLELEVAAKIFAESDTPWRSTKLKVLRVEIEEAVKAARACADEES